MKKLKFTTKTTIALSALLVAAFLNSCDRPHHQVYAGKQNMIVYAKKLYDGQSDKYGKYEYWITDATEKDWLLIANTEFDIGDTVVVQKHCR